MVIVHLVDSLAMGGMERLVVDLAIHQKRLGHHTGVICLVQAGRLADEVKKAGIAVTVLGKRPGPDLKAMRHLVTLMRLEKVEVLHTHNPSANFYGAPAAKWAGARMVINTRHGMGDFPYNRKREGLYRLSLFFTDKVVCVCERARMNFTAMGTIPKSKSKVVYNGIDLTRFRATGSQPVVKRNGLGLSEAGLVIGCVARLEPAKDIATLLRAFALVLSTHPNARLVVVGDGSEGVRLRTLSHSLGLSGMVTFLGARDDVPELLKYFDVFVLPSLSEGLSLTLIEAMASGKPVVATDVGGNPEVVSDNETGLLCPPGRPDAMADRLGQVLDRADLRLRMGQRGAARAESLFSLGKMAEQYERIIGGA